MYIVTPLVDTFNFLFSMYPCYSKQERSMLHSNSPIKAMSFYSAVASMCEHYLFNLITFRNAAQETHTPTDKQTNSIVT